MEKELLCTSSDNQLIKKFSQALLELGIKDGARHYYTTENCRYPFFKIPKAYKKENPDDPSVHYAFVDIDDDPPFSDEEYTVFGNFVHEHFDNPEQAAELVSKLLSGEVVEVAIVYPDRMAGFFVKNTGDPQKNVDIIAENFESIKPHLDTDVAVMNGGHFHSLFEKSFPYSLQYGPSTDHVLSGISIYMVSSVLAEHPEYYVSQMDR